MATAAHKTAVQKRNDRLKFREDTLRQYVKDIRRELLDHNVAVLGNEQEAARLTDDQVFQLLQDRLTEVFRKTGIHRY